MILFPEYLGDYHFLVPFLYELKKCYPDSEIDFYTTGMIQPLAQEHPAISRAFVIPKLRENRKLSYKLAWPFVKQLRQEKYDVAYFTNDYLYWICLFSRVKTIIRENYSVLYRLFCKGTPHKALRDNFRHAMQRHVNNLEWMFKKVVHPEGYTLNPGIKDEKLPLPKDFAFETNDFIAMNTDAVTIKNYDRHFYHELTQFLLDKGHKLALIGLRDKYELGNMFSSHENFETYVGKTTLFEATRIIKDSKLFIGLDSGTAHIASGQGARSVILYPPKGAHPSLTGAFYKECYGYKYNVFSSKCERVCRHFPSCKYEDCHQDYDLDEVKALTEEVLEGKDRNWAQKQNEILKHTIHVAVLSDANTALHAKRIKELSDQGLVITTWSIESLSKLSFKQFFNFIKENRVRLVVWKEQGLPFKLKVWDWFLKVSERHYMTVTDCDILKHDLEVFLNMAYDKIKQ